VCDDTDKMARERSARGLFRFDVGWLYLLSGLALLVSVMVLPTVDDLRDAEWERDTARDLVAWQSKRIERHSAFLESVEAGDEATIRDLAATQLNLAPKGSEAIIGFRVGTHGEAGVLDRLEPERTPRVRTERERSRLEWLATDSRARLVTLGIGSMLVAIGLVVGTPTAPSGGRDEAEASLA